MDEVPHGFRPCLLCTRSCYNEHWPFPDKECLRPPCFVKALCDSNLAAMATCWMVIPSAWLKLHGDEVGNSAILHGPSGNTWQVGVGRPKWVAFRVGWRTFAADNCLEKGDMLVFTLIGNSEFSVQIFDSRTCLEKETSLTATNTGCYDSRSPVLLGEKRKQKDDENPSELKRICLHESEGPHLRNNDQALESFRNGNDLQQSWSKLSTCSSAARILLDLNSKPLFIHQNPTRDCGRSFPEANHHVLDVVDARTLQKYPSGIVYQPHPISIRSHVVGEVCSPQGQFKAQECGPGGIGPATRFASQRRPVMDGTRERSSEFPNRRNNSSTLMTPDHCSHTLDLNREHFEQAIGPQILSPAVILERGKALELARRAQDMIDRPSHMVVLRAFHVHGRAFVRFPVTFGKQHMPRKTAPMHLLDSNGHRWPMTWLRDNETHMGLTRGWRDFCLAEGLSEGDVCIFELMELNKLTLLIHVFRSLETRKSSQVVVTRSKRLDLSHVGHPAHNRSSGRKKVLEGEGRGLRQEVSLGGEGQLPTTLEEHIFRVVDVDHRKGAYQHHYRIISPRMDRVGCRATWKTQTNGQVMKEIATKRRQPRRIVSRNLYRAIQKTIAKHSETSFIENKWFCRTKPSDLSLNLDAGNIRAPVPNAPCDSLGSKISSCRTWRNPISKLVPEIHKKSSSAKENTPVHQPSPITNLHSCVLGTSPSTGNIVNDICETSNETSQQIASLENERMFTPFADGEDDSEPEEENYYRVIRILKKRYFQNEKQYLTELDGPMMQSDGCGGIREYDDMKWWVPEKSFSSGFASCYLR